MTIVLAILLGALLVKDVAPLGDRYLLRGIAEGLAFLAGSAWLVARGTGVPWRRYWLLIGYIGILALTIDPSKGVYGVVQVLSLATTILFFIAYAESTTGEAPLHNRIIFALALALIVICGGSLALVKLRPELAYLDTFSGSRFRGLFSMPGMMGTAAGLLVGMASYGGKHWLIRIFGLLAAVPCLYLTGSRTFWVACVLSLGLTSVLYIKRRTVWLLLGGGVLVAVFIVAVEGGVRLSHQDQAQVLRSDSLENLSGRTTIWNLAFKKFQERYLRMTYPVW
jgi:O-antigen ligase